MFGVILFRRLRISAVHYGVFLSESSTLIRFLSSTISSSATSENHELQKAHSFTVSYLVNSCGLSPETAIVASNKVQLRNPETPDSVLAFLRTHEFSDSQISNLVRKHPKYLLSDPIKTFLPKLEFFYSKGVSKETMAKVLSKDALLLGRSLDNHIAPCFDRLKNVIASEELVLATLNNSWMSFDKHWENVVPNIRLLKILGFSDSRIASALVNFHHVMMVKPERFSEAVNKVKDMGFDPNKFTFMLALQMFTWQSLEKRWRENSKVYEKWGWSESDILTAFKYHPNCMMYSEEKISKTMDYLVNVMGQPAKEIARCPVILCYSLVKRIQPRCSVLRVLLRKKLCKQDDVKLYSLIQCVENKFLAEYVTKYEKEVPLLMSVYRGKVDIDDA